MHLSKISSFYKHLIFIHHQLYDSVLTLEKQISKCSLFAKTRENIAKLNKIIALLGGGM
jgi:hypothetical protein